MNNLLEINFTKLDQEIEALEAFVSEQLLGWKETDQNLKARVQILNAQNLLNLRRLKRELRKARSHDVTAAEHLSEKISALNADYSLKKRKLDQMLKNALSDYRSSTRIPKERLEVLKDVREKIAQYKKPVLVNFNFKSEPRDKREAVYFVTERFDPFIKRLSKSVYRNAFRRYGKKISYQAAYETDTKTRINAHAILECPQHVSLNSFKRRIRNCWKAGGVMIMNPDHYYTDDPSDFGNYAFKEDTKDLREKNFGEYVIP